jgi:hypothetical protein
MNITISEQTASDLRKAINFFSMGCVNRPCDGEILSTEKMKLLGINPERLYRLVKLSNKIENDIRRKTKQRARGERLCPRKRPKPVR